MIINNIGFIIFSITLKNIKNIGTPNNNNPIKKENEIINIGYE